MNIRFSRHSNCGHGRILNNAARPEGKVTKNQEHQYRSTGSTMKVFYLLLFSMVFLFASAADAQNNDKKNVLFLGVRADAPPFSFFDREKETPDKAKGYTVDLCRLIAERAVESGLYCSIEYKEINATDRFDALINGQIHLLCGATTVTLERMRAADFSLFTFLSGASIMYLEANFKKDTPNNNTLMVGVLGNTTSENRARQIAQNHQLKYDNFGLPKPREVKVKPVDNHFQCLEMLKKRTIEAYVADREILLALRQKDMQPDNKTDIVVSEDYYTIEPYAIGIERGNSELRYIANSVLSELYGWESSGYRGEHIFTVLWRNFPRKRFSKSLEALYRFQRISKGQELLKRPEKVKCP